MELNPVLAGFRKELPVVQPDLVAGPDHRSPVLPDGPLVWFRSGDEHYVMASTAGSDWVHRVRAAGGRVVLTHLDEHFAAQLTELPALEAAELLGARIRHRGPDGRPVVHEDEVRRRFGIGHDATPDEIEAIAGAHHVFRIDVALTPPPLGV